MSADKYEITKWIGGGAFGSASVCHTRDNPDQEYVIKKIRLNGLGIKETQAAIQEARLLRKLSSPFIVKYVDSFVTDTGIAIIIEYCDGGDLSTQIAHRVQSGKSYTESEINAMVYQLSTALDHCHSHKILHRDVKTENIFVCTGTKSVKLGDFGISRVLDAESSMAETQIGTAYYLSPEICKGEPYSYRSDIWALGCVAYELLNLHRPFETGNGCSLVLAIVRAKYRSMNEKYTKTLRSIIQSMLSVDPSQRPTARFIAMSTGKSQPSHQLKDLKEELSKMKLHVCQSSTFEERLNTLYETAFVDVNVSALKCEAHLITKQLKKALGDEVFDEIHKKAHQLPQSSKQDEVILESLIESKHHKLIPKLTRLLSIEQKL